MGGGGRKRAAGCASSLKQKADRAGGMSLERSLSHARDSFFLHLRTQRDTQRDTRLVAYRRYTNKKRDLSGTLIFSIRFESNPGVNLDQSVCNSLLSEARVNAMQMNPTWTEKIRSESAEECAARSTYSLFRFTINTIVLSAD